MRIRYLSLVISMLIVSSVVMTQTTPISAADFNKAVEVGSAQDNRPEFVIAVLGDSYASGEGAPDVNGKHSWGGDLFAAECFPNVFHPEVNTCYSEKWWSPDSWFSNRLAVFPQQDDPGWQHDARRCHRSSRGPAVHAAMMIAARFPDVKITVLDFACGGSKITQGLLYGYSGAEPGLGEPNLPSQVAALEEYARETSKKVDAIVMNIGGNDARFADLIIACIIEQPLNVDCTDDPLLIEVGKLLKDNTTPEWPSSLAPLRARYSVVASVLRGGRESGVIHMIFGRPLEVYLTGPANPSHDAPPSDNPDANPQDFCDGTQTDDWDYSRVSRNEAVAMEKLVGGATNSMNDAMQRAANRHGWIFIDTFNLARNHGVCADNNSFFRTNEDALRFQGDEGIYSVLPGAGFISPGIAHQNRAGYAARASEIAKVVGEQVRMRFRAPLLSLDRIEVGTESKVSFKWTDPTPPHLPETYWELEFVKVGSNNRSIQNSDGHGELSEVQIGSDRLLNWRISANGEYTARVRRCRGTPNGLYCGPFSNAVTFATFVPGTPVGLERFAHPDRNTIGLQWMPGPTTPISVRYEVAYGPYGGIPCPPGPLSGGTCGYGMVNHTILSTTLTTFKHELRALSKYVFQVRACSTAGCSPYTPQLVCSTAWCSPYTPLLNP